MSQSFFNLSDSTTVVRSYQSISMAKKLFDVRDKAITGDSHGITRLYPKILDSYGWLYTTQNGQEWVCRVCYDRHALNNNWTKGSAWKLKSTYNLSWSNCRSHEQSQAHQQAARP